MAMVGMRARGDTTGPPPRSKLTLRVGKERSRPRAEAGRVGGTAAAPVRYARTCARAPSRWAGCDPGAAQVLRRLERPLSGEKRAPFSGRRWGRRGPSPQAPCGSGAKCWGLHPGLYTCARAGESAGSAPQKRSAGARSPCGRTGFQAALWAGMGDGASPPQKGRSAASLLLREVRRREPPPAPLGRENRAGIAKIEHRALRMEDAVSVAEQQQSVDDLNVLD